MVRFRIGARALIAVLILSVGWCAPCRAASLAAKIRSIPASSLSGIRVIPFDVFSPALLEFTARGVDFPVASTTPGVTYTYNPELKIFEPSPSLGPTLLERPETVGKGKFNVGLTYLYGDVKELNGDPLTKSQGFAFYNGAVLQSFRGGVENFHRFSLVTNNWSATATYGITDEWDVNVLVPVIWTSLGVSAFVSSVEAVSTTISDDRLGLGDVLLRTKYRFHSGDPVDLAAAFILRLPTGKKTDFQGLGDTILTPLLVASRTFGRAGFYANLGFDVNATSADASRFRYGLGTAVQALDWLAVLVDILGSSGISSTSVDQVIAMPDSQQSAQEIQSAILRFTGREVDVAVAGQSGGPSRRAQLTLDLGRIDIVDLSAGLKVRLPGGAIAFATAIVPLNSDGVRADVVPTGGIYYSF